MTIKMLVAVAASAVVTGCASSPLSPSSTQPIKLALVGQSNAALGRPVFIKQPELDVVPIRFGAANISYWAPGTTTWESLVQDISGVPLDAFVFWQGEGDVKTLDYDVQLSDFVARVRAVAGNPKLLVVLVQYGPAYTGQSVNGKGSEAASIAFTQRDPNSMYVLTHDLEWLPDGGHMTENGYAAVAQRIVTMYRQRK